MLAQPEPVAVVHPGKGLVEGVRPAEQPGDTDAERGSVAHHDAGLPRAQGVQALAARIGKEFDIPWEFIDVDNPV